MHDDSFMRLVNPRRIIINYAEYVSLAFAKRPVNNRVMGDIEVSWNPLDEGWVKLDINGAIKSITK